MGRLNPDKLKVSFLNSAALDELPRRYTLTHSDRTGELFLSIGPDYDMKKIHHFYTRLMRDEVMAELVQNGSSAELRVYCHVSGGFCLGTAGWRNNILHTELPLAIEAIRYGDREWLEQRKEFDKAPVYVYFKSDKKRYNRIEKWGLLQDYWEEKSPAA